MDNVEQMEQEAETLRPAKERLLRALGYDLSTIPRDTHIVLTTSPFGRSFIEVDTGTGDPGRHYLSELNDPQDAALRDLIEQARS